MKKLNENSSLELIKKNISEFGHHIYLVKGALIPRFAYSIGLSPKLGFELILAGTTFYDNNEVKIIINKIAKILVEKNNWIDINISLGSLGTFSLREVDPSWSNELMLGAIDLYDNNQFVTLQIVPDKKYWTVDIPNLTQVYSTKMEPVWQWLKLPWKESVSSKAQVVTNLKALQGANVTEAMRWEENEFELFSGAGPDVRPEDARVIPISTLLGSDPSLRNVMKLTVGKGIWRDPVELEWKQWN